MDADCDNPSLLRGQLLRDSPGHRLAVELVVLLPHAVGGPFLPGADRRVVRPQLSRRQGQEAAYAASNRADGKGRPYGRGRPAPQESQAVTGRTAMEERKENTGEGVMFERVRKQETAEVFEDIRNEYADTDDRR